MDGPTIVREDLDEIGASFKFVVQDRRSSVNYNILDWNCSCNEVEKTGIPCPHLILCARSKHSKKYIELFNSRWIKEIPMNKKTSVKWIKRGLAGRSRRNIGQRRTR
jgi:hypothetical protein